MSCIGSPFDVTSRANTQSPSFNWIRPARPAENASADGLHYGQDTPILTRIDKRSFANGSLRNLLSSADLLKDLLPLLG